MMRTGVDPRAGREEFRRGDRPGSDRRNRDEAATRRKRRPVGALSRIGWPGAGGCGSRRASAGEGCSAAGRCEARQWETSLTSSWSPRLASRCRTHPELVGLRLDDLVGGDRLVHRLQRRPDRGHRRLGSPASGRASRLDELLAGRDRAALARPGDAGDLVERSLDGGPCCRLAAGRRSPGNPVGEDPVEDGASAADPEVDRPGGSAGRWAARSTAGARCRRRRAAGDGWMSNPRAKSNPWVADV